MAGGGVGATGTAENPNAVGGMGEGNAYSGQPTSTPGSLQGAYSPMAQPWSERYLTANPDVANAVNAGQGTAAEHYLNYGRNEGRLAPPTTNDTPSYYNTNPVGVDYANIFNPTPVFDERSYLQQKMARIQNTPGNTVQNTTQLKNYMASQGMTPQQHYAMYGQSEGLNPYTSSLVEGRQVATAQPTLNPQQQANYLNSWQQDYSQRARAATQAANQARTTTANTQWSKYLSDKAKAEAAATGKGVVDKAVEEALAQQATDNASSSGGMYTGKAGGSVPSGLRSLKGLTKP